MSQAVREQTDTLDAERLAVLEEVERRVLWLAVAMVDHANRARPNPSKVKVGGHQASSASSVGILTSLYFDFLRREDRVSVKPHASPVLHAIEYLLGRLDERYLTTLRAFGGLQAYPSRTKDPFDVDFSTGSVGLGCVAPNFAAFAERYVAAHGCHAPHGRYVALLGDAELDEGSVWEAVAEPALAGLDNLIWIVDLNRQSLDRVVPTARTAQLQGMFAAAGWTVLDARWGRRLEAAFARPGGDELRAAMDGLGNDEYQLLLRSPVAAVRARLPRGVLDDVDDDGVLGLLGDLGGHDQAVLHRVLREADACDGPAVIFASTIKAWGLATAGDPLNHSALLTGEQVAALAARSGVDVASPWQRFAPATAAAALCDERTGTLARAAPTPRPLPAIPNDLEVRYPAQMSSQAAFGQVLTDLARSAPDTAERVVTVAPDVATSTNLGGWINRAGVWSADATADRFAELGPRMQTWNQHPEGRHVELGISETNLLMLLGQLGLTGDVLGEPLLPVGTVYDPFVARALDALIYSVYGGGRFILAGTPSGVTLAPEGGAHQSVVTPAIGIATPGIVYWEPCFAQEVEWILLDAMRRLHDAAAPTSAFLRLSTAPVDQSLFPGGDRSLLRDAVLSGAYPIADRRDRPGPHHVEVWATGITVPAALRAADDLAGDDVHVTVVNCVSPDLVYRNWQRASHAALRGTSVPRGAGQPPVVTVIDGHPSSLAWVGSMLGAPALPLGVTEFGQSGTPDDLHAHMRIDAAAIAAACIAQLG